MRILLPFPVSHKFIRHHHTLHLPLLIHHLRHHHLLLLVLLPLLPLFVSLSNDLIFQSKRSLMIGRYSMIPQLTRYDERTSGLLQTPFCSPLFLLFRAWWFFVPLNFPLFWVSRKRIVNLMSNSEHSGTEAIPKSNTFQNSLKKRTVCCFRLLCDFLRFVSFRFVFDLTSFFVQLPSNCVCTATFFLRAQSMTTPITTTLQNPH